MSDKLNLPWTYDLNRQVILDCNGDDVGGLALASFDVASITAVNSHEAMREALKRAIKVISNSFETSGSNLDFLDTVLEPYRAALALSEVK